MRLHFYAMTLCVCACATSSARAQAPACPPDLRWSDATYLQRTTREGAAVASVEVHIHPNAQAWRVAFNGVATSILKMSSPADEDITLMLSADDVVPSQFAEVGTLALFPMANSAMRGLAHPCDLADGETRRIDSADFLVHGGPLSAKDAISGTVTRNGLRIVYSLLLRDGADAGQQWDGAWEAGTRPPIDLSTDVRAWRVYRGYTLIAPPVDHQRRLGDVLKQAATSTP